MAIANNRLPAIVLFALLCGCGTHLPAVPSAAGDVSVLVVDGALRAERVLRAGSPEAQKFTKWVDENADGWSKYYATAPSDGIFVSTRLGGLQFSRRSVIAVRKEGQYAKEVSEDVYALLRGEN